MLGTTASGSFYDEDTMGGGFASRYGFQTGNYELWHGNDYSGEPDATQQQSGRANTNNRIEDPAMGNTTAQVMTHSAMQTEKCVYEPLTGGQVCQEMPGVNEYALSSSNSSYGWLLVVAGIVFVFFFMQQR